MMYKGKVTPMYMMTGGGISTVPLGGMKKMTPRAPAIIPMKAMAAPFWVVLSVQLARSMQVPAYCMFLSQSMQRMWLSIGELVAVPEEKTFTISSFPARRIGWSQRIATEIDGGG